MFNPFMRNLLREQQDVACAITTSTARPSIFNTINRRKPEGPSFACTNCNRKKIRCNGKQPCCRPDSTSNGDSSTLAEGDQDASL